MSDGVLYDGLLLLLLLLLLLFHILMSLLCLILSDLSVPHHMSFLFIPTEYRWLVGQGSLFGLA